MSSETQPSTETAPPAAQPTEGGTAPALARPGIPPPVPSAPLPPKPAEKKEKEKKKKSISKKESMRNQAKKKEARASRKIEEKEKEKEHGSETYDIPLTLADPENQWEAVACTTDVKPAARSKHTAVYYKGDLYVFGGDDGVSRLNDLYAFNLEKKEWREVKTKGTPPEPRYYHSAVVRKHLMYVFGGYTNENKNDLWQFDFDTSQWTHLECSGDVPSKRSGHCAALHSSKMYVFGGYDGSARLNDVIHLDLDTLQWKVVETNGKAPSSRCNFSSSVVGNCMYIFAGHSGAATTADLYEFNFETNHWRQVETLGESPPKRLGHTSVVNHGNLYIFGGTSANKLTNDLYCLNLHTREWKVVNTTGDKPDRRAYHTAVVPESGGQSMYVFGGATVANPEERYPAEQAVLYQFRFEKGHPEDTLSSDMAKLLDMKILTDVTFSVGKKATSFHAHSLILANRCAVMARSLDKGSKKKKGTTKKKSKEKDGAKDKSGHISISPRGKSEIALPDAEPAVFEELLYFIYTGEVTNHIVPTSGSSEASSFTLEQVFALMSLAIEYELHRLIALCERKLRSMVSLASVIAAMKLNEPSPGKVISASLKEFCITFILKQYTEVITQEAFTSLDPTVLVEIMRLNQQSQADPSILDAKLKKIGPVEIPPNSLSEDLGKLRKEEKSMDVHFMVRKKKKSAHLVILAARCEYFQAFVRSGEHQKEAPTEVIIGSVAPTPEAFECFLDYLYTGKTDMPGECAVYLMTTPGFYGLTNSRLRAVCISNLVPNVDQDNLLRILDAANDVKAEQLKEYLLKELVKIYKFIIETKLEEVRELPKSLLVDIMVAVGNSLPKAH